MQGPSSAAIRGPPPAQEPISERPEQRPELLARLVMDVAQPVREKLRGTGMRVYQITENGIALQARIAGTRYWRSTELNE